MAEIDFEAEGLLEGLDGEPRQARLDLLKSLAEDGCRLEELRQAVEEDRLVLLPVERALGDSYRYTLEDVAEQAEVPADFLRSQIQALGLPVPQPGERILGERDQEAARRVKQVRDAGLPDDGILEVARVIGNSMARLAAANMAVIGETFIRPGDTERDLGLRYAAVANELVPELGRTLQFVLERHLHELVRQAVVSQAELASGQLPGATEIAVAFADLVGFTRLGERSDVGQIGEITGRLTELATAAAQPPVRLVKTIGDAAMLVSTEPAPLLDAVLGLVDAVEADERLPSVKAGGAWGHALARAGDWYGRPVNLASRITDAARPGSVLVADELAQQVKEAGDGFRLSRAGSRHFKGIKGNVRLARVRHASDET
jgi:adenylate cyclase